MDDWLPIDLHIHTALSPCADNQMTPNNIVNMARLLGLRVIAVTDHQAADNVRPVMQLAKRAGIICLPGIEVQSREEIHLLCYFADIAALEQLAAVVNASLDDRFKADPRFGEQLLMDEHDTVIGSKQVLLSQSCTMSLEQVWELVDVLGGCCVPAHVDRPAYSLLGQLGFVPPSVNTSAMEVSMHGILSGWKLSLPDGTDCSFITSSDAHCLEQLVTSGHTRVLLPKSNPESILSLLRNVQQGSLRTFVVDEY